MEEKTIKLAHGIINSCIAAHYLFKHVDEFKEDPIFVDALKFALKGSLHESWWQLKKQFGKRELNKIKDDFFIHGSERRSRFEEMDKILQDYHDSKFKRG